MNENSSLLNKITQAATLIFTILSIFLIFRQLNWLPNFGKPKWEGFWNMRVGRAELGETTTILKMEGGYLVGSYIIHDKETGKILVSLMKGTVSIDEETYEGDWIQTVHGKFQNKSKFSLIMGNTNKFKGSYYRIKKDSIRSENYPWTGSKIHSLF